MKNIGIYKLFKNVAIAGNVIFVLLVLLNGIDEGFRGALV